MGQTHASVEEDVREAGEDQSGYALMTLSELTELVAERGIAPPKRAGLEPDRATLTTLLQAFDAGVRSSGGSSGSPSREASKGNVGPTKPKVDKSVLSVLQQIRDAPGHMGVDIGGTLIKLALALPMEAAHGFELPEEFGRSGQTHPHLEVDHWVSGGESFVVRFISGSTSQMEQAVQHLGLRRSQSASPPLSDSDASTAVDKDMEVENIRFTRMYSDWSGEVFTTSFRPIRKIATSGGGASKYAPLFRDALRVEIEPVKELSAVVDGLLLLAAHHAEVGSTGGNDGQAADLFTVGEQGESLPLPWPEPLFPLILVNMGSGVSILRVDSDKDSDYVRVGGTACGGATFLGLARALTSAETFEQALKLAEGGDARNVDKLVSDIYGEEGCANLGLPGGLTACNFGKLSEHPNTTCSEQDLARALLQMVTQQSVLLATSFAKHSGCLDRVFFVGGFVDEANWMARVSIAKNFRNLGGCAYFLRHSDFLGSLGSLKIALRAFEDEEGSRRAIVA